MRLRTKHTKPRGLASGIFTQDIGQRLIAYRCNLTGYQKAETDWGSITGEPTINIWFTLTDLFRREIGTTSAGAGTKPKDYSTMLSSLSKKLVTTRSCSSFHRINPTTHPKNSRPTNFTTCCPIRFPCPITCLKHLLRSCRQG